MKISKFLIGLMLVAASGAVVASCGSDNPDTPEVKQTLQVDATVPSAIDVVKGDEVTITKSASSSVLTSDQVLLQGNGGSFTCPVTSVASTSFTFALPTNFVEGTYSVTLKRGDLTKNLGTTTIKFVEKGWTPKAGTTVYGTVKCGNDPVAGVVISDGVDCAVTNDEGRYELASKKAYGYVFMSIPSGYEAPAAGVLPVNHQTLNSPATTPENVNFSLTKVDQTNYRVLFFADMHLANRNDDINQYKKFTADVNAYGRKGRTYAITLGDMTWDIYWYDNKFQFADYLKLVNVEFSGMTMYHTIGNHDNDYKALNNTTAKKPYIESMAPNYYSFNIGGVHYVALDNIDCSNYDGTTSRNYTEKFFVPQLAWLAKDLSYVDKNTPVVVTMHAPVFKPSGATNMAHNLSNGADLLAVLKDFKTVHIVSGHTHKNYNATPKHTPLAGYPNIMEHNVCAVCGDWWWSGKCTPGALMSCDGAPAGYSIWDVDNAKFTWQYKGTNLAIDKQFRTYDLNNVKFTTDDVPGLGGEALTSFKRYCTAYPGTVDNRVLINMWNYDPDWTVTVTTENGQTLTPKAVEAYDPLHILAMSIPRFKSTKTTVPNFITQQYSHFFEVTAPDASVDLTITVKDRFGNTYTEKMERPKAFNLDSYVWK